jgi:hypothetical protein
MFSRPIYIHIASVCVCAGHMAFQAETVVKPVPAGRHRSETGALKPEIERRRIHGDCLFKENLRPAFECL